MEIIVHFLCVTIYCATLVAGFDLASMVRIAQCRSECLRMYSNNDHCERGAPKLACERTFHKPYYERCWNHCEDLDNVQQQGSISHFCHENAYKDRPDFQTACIHYLTRVTEKRYDPSMLPSPDKGPVSLDTYDVAIVLHGQYQQWELDGYFYSNYVPMLGPCNWIVVVTKDGIRNYSWQEWVPKLDSLKEGPLFEATISWRDVQMQLYLQLQLLSKRINDNQRQLYLKQYGEKVLAASRDGDENSRPISREVFQRFFFQSKNHDELPKVEDFKYHCSVNKDDHEAKNKSFVVTWGPETGGLTGNQVTDSDTAQISLLPGTKYLVRIASSNGPGSFPIVVDTQSTVNFSHSSPSSSSSSSDHVCFSERYTRFLWQYFIISPLLLFLLVGYIMVDYHLALKRIMEAVEKL